MPETSIKYNWDDPYQWARAFHQVKFDEDQYPPEKIVIVNFKQMGEKLTLEGFKTQLMECFEKAHLACPAIYHPYRTEDTDQYIPTTIEEAAKQVAAMVSPEDSENIKQGKLQPHEVHFTGGMAMRNEWKLWAPETPIKRDAVENYGIAMADDLSDLIMAWAWALIREKPFDPVDHCKQYHRHWYQFGETSLSAGGYNEDGTVKQKTLADWKEATNKTQPPAGS